LAWLVSALLLPQGLAKDFIVQSTADVADANPGDGKCATSGRAALDLGLCTLRAAIQEANALGGVHTITLPLGTYKLTISGPGGGGELNAAVGDLDVVGSDVRIHGAGEGVTKIDGNQLEGVFEVFSNGRLELCDVTILNGKANGGGGILNLGAVKVCNSTIQSNFSQTSGGGIANLEGAEMVIRDSTISGNSTVGGGGGIMNGGKLTITRTKVTGNIAAPKESGGGVINLPGGSLTITDSTISGNSAGMGGGVLNNGTAIMRRSTVSGNTAHDGAGLANLSQFSITNSTISGNQFSSNRIESSAACSIFDPCIGGGILNSPLGGLEIVNTTINNKPWHMHLGPG
jgi:CSLREA domain-containing protein